MLSASRASLAEVEDLLAQRRSDPAFAGLAADLYSACDLLGREKSLREALSDSGRSERTRSGDRCLAPRRPGRRACPGGAASHRSA